MRPGLVWTPSQAAEALAADVAAKEAGLDAALPWWRELDPVRQDALCNLAFNLGVRGLCAFETFLGFLEARDFERAARDLAGTAWAGEVGARAARLVRQIQTGFR